MLTRSKVGSKTHGDVGMDEQSNVSARRKEKNFKREEDIFLCRAWMTTPGDPEAEKDQSSMTFWERAGEKYASLIGNNYVRRTGQSLPQRWSKIRSAVSKFCAIYKNINDQNPNSYTEQDMIKMALLAYKKEKKEKFKLLHCWTELRNSYKWNHERGSKVRRRNVAQHLSMDEHFSLDDNDDCPTPTDMSDQSNEQDDAVVFSPCAEPSPISAMPMSVYTCPSGIVDFDDPDDHTANDVQADDEQVKAKKKESNYTQEEDVLLCRAWMATRGDPAKGKDESMTVWERIGEEYARLIGSRYVSRSGKSLPQRWHRIRPAVLKFCEVYKKINDQKPSGHSGEDMINMARAAYKREGNGKFKFLHCWTVLRNSRKWNEVAPGGRSRKNAMYSQEPITSEHFGLDDDYDSLMAIDTTLEQLEGQPFEEQKVGRGKGEGYAASVPSPCGASFPRSMPLTVSRNMNSNARDHVGMDVKTEVSEQVNTRRKDMNFTQEEDILLCRAWMATKGDPKTGGDQSSETLWEKIGAGYASLIGNNHAPRPGKSLPQRWCKIRTAVAKFCSIYKNINDPKASSVTEVDKINMAVLAFEKEQKEKFKFLHCWTELRNSPKWNFETAYGIQYRRRHAAMLSQQSSSSEHSSHDDDEDSPMPTPASLDQPQRQGLAMQKRKGQDIDTSSSDMEELLPRTRDLVRDLLVDKLEAKKVVMRKRKGRDGDTGSSEVEEPVMHSQDLAREILAQKVKKLDELLEIEREKRETKIMLIDPTTLPDVRRQYFEKLQQKILERVCGKPPRSK